MKNVINEEVRNKEKYAKRPDVDISFLQQQIQFLLEKIDKNMETFVQLFPAPNSENNVYPATENYDWTTSFWTGMLWLAYEVTGNEKYRKVAEIQVSTFKDRLDHQRDIETHDLGFLYTLSCVAAYKLTGNEEAKETALRAADYLMVRYLEKAKRIPRSLSIYTIGRS